MKTEQKILDRIDALNSGISTLRGQIADMVLAGTDVSQARERLILAWHEWETLNWVMTDSEQLGKL